MSKEQLTDLYTEANTWWDNLRLSKKVVLSRLYHIDLKNITIGQIRVIYDRERHNDIPFNLMKYPLTIANMEDEHLIDNLDKEVAELSSATGTPPIDNRAGENRELENDNKTMRDALEKIANYNEPGLTDRSIALNLSTIASVCLYQLGNKTVETPSKQQGG